MTLQSQDFEKVLQPLFSMATNIKLREYDHQETPISFNTTDDIIIARSCDFGKTM